MTSIEFSLSDLDFQQESFDFSILSSSEFEGLIFHLLDEMGFSNLVWRKGGEGNSATDGGRDLEATYWRVEPVGSTELRYWFEVKYRSGQLEKSQVQKAVLEASGETSLDQVVIVTNSTVSNPCLDWIRDFQKKQIALKVSLWQGHDLDLLLRKNPRTLARFLPTSLSYSGRCKVIESRFLNLFLLPSVDELEEIWERRRLIGDRAFLFMALVLAESAFGDLAERPWGMKISRKELITTSATAVASVFLLIHRIHTLNRRTAPLFDGIAYLIACVLVRIGYKEATKILYEPESLFETERQITPEISSYRAGPVLDTLYDQLAVFCSSANYCPKLHYRDPEEKPDFFARFCASGDLKANRDTFLVMSSQKEECQLGIVSTGSHCPLPEQLPDGVLQRSYVEKRLKFAEEILKRRVEERIKCNGT